MRTRGVLGLRRYTTGPARTADLDRNDRQTSDDAPETRSELKFRIRGGVRESFGVDPDTGRRRGLRTALRELQTGDVATA